MENSENDITQIFRGETTYRKLKAANGQKMMDAYQKLTEGSRMGRSALR